MALTRFLAPRVVSSWIEATRAFRQIQDGLDQLSASGFDDTLHTTDFTAVPGGFYRIAPAKRVQVFIPAAAASNGGQTIRLQVERPHAAVIVLAPAGQTIDGFARATFTTAGLVTLTSNGFNTWSSFSPSSETIATIVTVPGTIPLVPGVPGRDGEDGRDGLQGIQGIQGVQGVQGIQGVPGTQGPPGIDGRDGEDGREGPPGRDGGAGATPTWAQVLVAGSTSGASSPTIDSGQQLNLASGSTGIIAANGLIASATTGNVSISAIAAAADITVNTVGGVAIQAGASPIGSVTGTDILMAADADIRIGAASGVNITAGSASAGVADPGDAVINATGQIILNQGPTPVTGSGVGVRVVTASGDIQAHAVAGGVAIDANFASSSSPAIGDIELNCTSGMRLHAGATQQAATTGVFVSSDTTSTFSASGNVLVQSGLGSTTTCRVVGGDVELDASDEIHSRSVAGTSIAAPSVTICNSGTPFTGSGFLKIVEAAASTPTVAAGEGMYWVQSGDGSIPKFTDDTNQDWSVGYSNDVSVTSLTPVAVTTAQVNILSATYAASCLRAGAVIECYLMGKFNRGATATATNVQLQVRDGTTVLDSMAAGALNVTNGTLAGRAWICLLIQIPSAVGAAVNSPSRCTWAHDLVTAGTVVQEVIGTRIVQVLATNAARTFNINVIASATVAGVTFTPDVGWIKRI